MNSATVYTNRIARLTAAMRQKGIDGVALVPGANLRYLTGLVFHPGERLIMAFFPANGSRPCMVLPAMEVDRAHTSTRLHAESDSFLHFYPWSDADGPMDALKQALAYVLRDKDTTVDEPTVAAEFAIMRVMEMRALEAAQPGIHVIDAEPFFTPLRIIKDAAELAAMDGAVRIIETALQAILPRIKPDVTERQLAATWKHEMLLNGAEGESFACMVASGANSANPHHQNSNRAFQPGDLIILDGGVIYQGYASDITRTVALGEPDATARNIYRLVQEANAAGRAAVQPGITGEAVDQAARQVIAAGGYGDFFLHRTGHGLGMDCHEEPNIVAGNTQPLAVGMTFTIEPGIYIAGVGGVRIEDDVVVTETGGRSLTSFDRDLLVLPVP